MKDIRIKKLLLPLLSLSFFQDKENKVQKKKLVRTKKNISIPIENFTQHTFIIGSSRYGKTVIMKRILVQLLHDVEHLGSFCFVIHDVKGDWIEEFYTAKTGYILNPLDKRSVVFNLFSLVKDLSDIIEISSAVIPESKNGDAVWHNTARTIFSGIMHACIDDYKRGGDLPLNNMRIKEYLNAGMQKLIKRLKGLEKAEMAYNLLKKGESQQENFYTNFLSYMTLFDAIAESNNEELNLKDFIQKSKGKMLFLANFVKFQQFVSPFLSLFLTFLIREVTNQTGGGVSDNRLYLFLDELGELKKIPNLVQFLGLTGSFGGAAFLGIQDKPRAQANNGEDFVETLFANTATRIFFRLGDEKTQKTAEGLIGEQRVRYFDNSYSLSNIDKNSSTKTEKSETRKIFLGSNFSKFKKHEFIFQTTGTDWCHVKGKFIPELDIYPKIAEKEILVDSFKISFERYTKEEEDHIESGEAEIFQDIDEDMEAFMRQEEQAEARSKVEINTNINNDITMGGM